MMQAGCHALAPLQPQPQRPRQPTEMCARPRADGLSTEAHGAAVRELSKNPILGEQLVMNYKTAELAPRQRAMLDFAALLTTASSSVEESDRQNLRDHGPGDRADPPSALPRKPYTTREQRQ